MKKDITMINTLLAKINNHEQITKKDALSLIDAPLEELAQAADSLREKYCGNTFDMCSIINAKSGKCSENCRFCAQSAYYDTAVTTYPLMDTEEIMDMAKHNSDLGVPRFSLVTSGRKLDGNDVQKAAESIHSMKENTNLHICVSMGLLDVDSYRQLKEAGAERVHNNLEASPNFFPSVCSTHTTEDKINAIKAAKEAGLEVCSGGILGLGESMEDRIDMVLTIRELGIKSIPVNVLSPIPGTPFEKNKPLSMDEIRRTVAIFRFLIPDGAIRLAGGRGNMPDHGKLLFQSGANACITGDMLTTSGYTIESDTKMLNELGYVIGTL